MPGLSYSHLGAIYDFWTVRGLFGLFGLLADRCHYAALSTLVPLTLIPLYKSTQFTLTLGDFGLSTSEKAAQQPLL